MYIIKKHHGGLMVANPGRKSSYTNSLKHAQKFETKEQAEKNACGNEYVSNTDNH